MAEKKQDEKIYLHKYLAECVLAAFSNRPEVLKVLEIVGKYISIIEDLRSRLPVIESAVNRLVVDENFEENFLVFVDGKLHPAKCQVERDIYTDQYIVDFPPDETEDHSTKLIQVIELKFSTSKIGYPKCKEEKDDRPTR